MTLNRLDQIRIVLVKPLYGGNVGAACRAMKNMGFKSLYIVNPNENLDMSEARKMAYKAVDILQNRKEVKTLEEAVSTCGVVAGTTARAGLYRSHAKTSREWAPELLTAAHLAAGALVFGPEDRGLVNEELALCTKIIQIPSTDAYASLNLAQAVLVCCYDLYVAMGCFESQEEKSPEASSALREQMFEIWRTSLLDIGFMKEDKANHMMMGLRRIFSRGSLTEVDVKILMGTARQAQWCATELKKKG
ncbi:MAG: TrmJ/YjtD family RNA methyltransferase [Kiritimatiellae bacterium]|nr:TrmJ/YjtD family RNA methyltransferase [Kiritimatiellia bacterium]